MATSETTNWTLPEFQVSQEQENELMIRYTKEYTREHAFAVDLMTHVMEMCNLPFENYIFLNEVGRFRPSDLDSGIKKYIGLVVPESTKKTKHSLMGMTINLEDTNYEEFKCFANAMSYHFKNVLQESDYLDFCIGMASMCCVAHRHGMTMAPYFGIMLMCSRLPSYLIEKYVFMDPWEHVRDSANLSAILKENELRRASEDLLEMELRRSESTSTSD